MDIGLAAATARGKAALLQWTLDGTLVLGSTVCTAWGVSYQVLEQLEDSSELFSLLVTGQRYYLAILCEHSQEQVAQVSRALQGVEPAGQAIFWLRQHGGLRGRTVPQGLRDGHLDRVVKLALAWREERVGGPG